MIYRLRLDPRWHNQWLNKVYLQTRNHFLWIQFINLKSRDVSILMALELLFGNQLWMNMNFLKVPQEIKPKKKACENNSKTRNTSLCGLSNSMLVKIMNYRIVKEIWVKSHNIYGDDKVKKSKLQIYWGQFDSKKMKEEEKISISPFHLDEVLNSII